MAIALTINLNAALSGAVDAYFKKFRVLPPRLLSVTQTKILTGAASFETLLNAIVAETGTRDFVIVTHGHETGNGLFLKLATRGGTAVGFETTHEMLQLLMDIGKRPNQRVDADDLAKLQLTEAETKRLVGLMDKARGRSLNQVEFRGCNLGRNPTSVSRFREFLGAAIFGAPNLHSFFGLFPVRASAGIMRDHAASHQGETHTYTSTLLGKTCHCCIGVNEKHKPENGHIVADDTATLDAWIKANFDPAQAIGTDTRLPIHGLWEMPKVVNPDDPLQVTSDPRPIFPLAVVADGGTTKNEYALHVIYKP